MICIIFGALTLVSMTAVTYFATRQANREFKEARDTLRQLNKDLKAYYAEKLEELEFEVASLRAEVAELKALVESLL